MPDNSVCLQCSKNFYAKPSNKKIGGGIYCSTNCANEAKKTGQFYNCATCDKKIWKRQSEIKKSKTGNLFCSHHCATIKNNSLFRSDLLHPNYLNGDRSYRIRAIKKYGLSCSNKENCPLKNIEIPDYLYEVDHIDQNRKNNHIDNLRVLCVWCHRKRHLE